MAATQLNSIRDEAAAPRVRRWPLTLWIGLGIIFVCEGLLLVDVWRRGGAVVPEPVLPARGALGCVARWVAVNMTVLCWVAYLLVFDGLLAGLARRRASPDIASIRRRPHRFLAAWLTSVPVWCWFDWVNFHFLDAWQYHGLPPQFWQRVGGYFVAFAAISPGMFLAAQALQGLGLKRLRTQGVRINRPVQVLVFLMGLAFTVYPLLVRAPIGSLTLWVSLLFLLDPLNHWLGGPSIVGDWRAGRFGRTLSLMAGGAICGLLWELWNYWALTKWTYKLPFLGDLEQYRYFEMPWLGFLGFLPFALECWVVLNTIIILIEKTGLRVVEPLADEDTVL